VWYDLYLAITILLPIWILTPLAAALSRHPAHEGQPMDNTDNMVQGSSKCSPWTTWFRALQNVLSISAFKIFSP